MYWSLSMQTDKPRQHLAISGALNLYNRTAIITDENTFYRLQKCCLSQLTLTVHFKQ